jgi:hypothetical protein
MPATQPTMLKYEFTLEETKFLISALNRVQFSGIEAAKSLIAAVEKLAKEPTNLADIEKETLSALQAKYAPAKPAETK